MPVICSKVSGLTATEINIGRIAGLIDDETTVIKAPFIKHNSRTRLKCIRLHFKNGVLQIEKLSFTLYINMDL